jgi:hypothetical protein
VVCSQSQGFEGEVMTARKAAKPKRRKIKSMVANQAIADIDAMFKIQKKLDLELKRIKKNLKTILSHQYFM